MFDYLLEVINDCGLILGAQRTNGGTMLYTHIERLLKEVCN